MQNIKIIILSLSLVSILMGCSLSKDATKDNFENVINTYYEKNCILITPHKQGRLVFPEKESIELLPSNNVLAKKQNRAKTKQFDALVSIGLLKVKERTKEKSGGIFKNTKTTVKIKEYSLTTKGTHAYYQDKGKKGFCVATKKVNEIIDFSEPSFEMMGGVTTSTINFIYSLSNMSDWADSPVIAEAFPYLAKKLEENKSQSIALFFMADGWVHQNEAKL